MAKTLTFDSLSNGARAEVERVLAGELEIAPEYSNLSEEAAVYLLISTHNMDEVDARMQLAISRGEISGDLLEVTP